MRSWGCFNNQQQTNTETLLPSPRLPSLKFLSLAVPQMGNPFMWGGRLNYEFSVIPSWESCRFLYPKLLKVFLTFSGQISLNLIWVMLLSLRSSFLPEIVPSVLYLILHNPDGLNFVVEWLFLSLQQLLGIVNWSQTFHFTQSKGRKELKPLRAGVGNHGSCPRYKQKRRNSTSWGQEDSNGVQNNMGQCG